MSQRIDRSGPLFGTRIVEFPAIGPVPFTGMLLSDMGAEVIRIGRPGDRNDDQFNFVARGRVNVTIDLKSEGGAEHALQLLESADALIEGFRPGVMERLGLGPQPVLARNPRLVFGRMTGWGQSGPLAHAAGHDINYIALTGALSSIGSPDGPPVPPLNLIGDYGGGSLYLAMGVLAALLEASKSGEGQVVDAAMCDGALSLMTATFARMARGDLDVRRGRNLLDGGAPFYGVYETADGKYVSVAAIEPQFFQVLCERAGVAPTDESARLDKRNWAEQREAWEQTFRQRTQAEWCEILEGTDACFSPVLSVNEVMHHPHNISRGAFIEVAGISQPAAAPRFSRTRSKLQGKCSFE